MTVLVVILSIALVASLVAVAVLARRLRAAGEEVEDLHAEISRRDAVRPPMPVKAAGRVLQTMVSTASRVRERGVGGMLLATVDDFTRWATEERSKIAKVASPDGTVTVFFSDIEGSTRLNNELGDERWVRLLTAHDTLVEQYVDRHHGLIVKKQGDGHMVVFSTPAQAIRAALEIQRALNAQRQRSRELRRTPVSVRIGVHTGKVVEKNGDFFGQNVALAARIAAEAEGGEILVSNEIVEALGEEFAFAQDEELELKGFTGAQQLWRVAGS